MCLCSGIRATKPFLQWQRLPGALHNTQFIHRDQDLGAIMTKKNEVISEAERKRRRALVVFQLVIYGYMFVAFCIQMYMYSQRDW